MTDRDTLLRASGIAARDVVGLVYPQSESAIVETVSIEFSAVCRCRAGWIRRDGNVAEILTEAAVTYLRSVAGRLSQWHETAGARNSGRKDTRVPGQAAGARRLTFTFLNSIRKPSASKPTYPRGTSHSVNSLVMAPFTHSEIRLPTALIS